MQWFAVQVPTHCESKIKSYLEKRKKDGLAGKVGRVIVPEKDGELLMPGYVFVEADWWPDAYIRPGISWVRVLGAVAEEEIERVLRADVKPKIKKGDRVKVTDGPLVNQVGTVVSATTKRAKVSFVFFGQEVAVDFELEALRKIQEQEA
ncbi:MAG: transcription termination/antitermination NusG family protein [Bacillota bacterium]